MDLALDGKARKRELFLGADLQTADNLGSSYTVSADDGAESERCREASMLFSIAEGQLNDEDEDLDAVLRTVNQAVKIFRDVGNSVGLADSLRLCMHGTRMKAAKEHEDGHGAREEELLRDAEALLRREMALFKARIDERGEAAMLLAIGEALYCLGGSPRLAEALDSLLDAQDIARELGDVKLEALIALERSTVLHKRHRFKPACQAAKEAKELFKSIGDLQNEGFAWHALGSAQINNGCIEDGFVSQCKALSIYRKLGLRTREGKCLCSLAEWYLAERDDFALGIKAAQEAKAVFQDLENLHLELQAQRLIVEGHYKMKDYVKAMDLATDGLELARESGSKKEVFKSMSVIAEVHMESKQIQQALDTAAEVLAIAREMEDPRNEAQAFLLKGRIFDFDGVYLAAEEQFNLAIEILEPLRRYEEEAFQALHWLGRTWVKMDACGKALLVVSKARSLAVKAEDTYLEATAMLSVSAANYGLYLDARARLRSTSSANDGFDRLEQAKNAAFLARELFQEEGYQRGEAKVLRLALSDYFVQENNFKDALRCAQEGVQLMEDVGDNRTACLMWLRVAEIYLEEGRPTEASHAAMGALKFARVEEDRRATHAVLCTLLNANHSVLSDVPMEDRQNRSFRERVERMARYAREALGIAVKVDNTEMEANANLFVSSVSLLQGKDKEALQAAETTIKLAQECNDLTMWVNAMLHKAQALDSLGDMHHATRILGDAMVKADEIGHSQARMAAKDHLEQIAEAQGKAQGAFPLLRSAAPGPRRHPEYYANTEVYRRPDIARVKSFIQQLVKNMNVTESGTVDADEALMETGIDSLASVELRTQLQQEFRVNLPSTVMYNHPSVSALARLLVDQCTEKRIAWHS